MNKFLIICYNLINSRASRMMSVPEAICAIEMTYYSQVPTNASGIGTVAKNSYKTAYSDTSQWSRALRIESVGSSTVPLEIRSWFKNKTITDISSWKWRRTFLSILRRSEYRISRFLAASWRAALISLLALPCSNTIVVQ